MARLFPRPVLFAVLAACIAVPASADELIRVRILENARPSVVTVGAVQSELDVFAGAFDQPIATIARDESAEISLAAGQLSIVVDGMRLFAEQLRIRGGGSLLLRVERGGAERVLPGELQIAPGDGDVLILDNVLDLEAYVASVVAHEYGFDDLEGSKAMAVVARTYALRRAFGDEAPLVDHIGSQVYGDERRVTDVARRAAIETRGEILTHGGEPIEAVYSSSSGGRTANNEDVWDARPLPYLRSVEDPFDGESPHREWTSSLNREEVLRALSRETGFTVTGFIAGDRAADGRVRSVDLLRSNGSRHEVSANAFRLMLNRAFGVHSLKSTNFEARREGDSYVFTGRGFGHGVGLNQHGARYLASRGYSYRDILGFYYTDVRLGTHRSGQVADAGDLLVPDGRLLADAGEVRDQPAPMPDTEETVLAEAPREDPVPQADEVRRPDRAERTSPRSVPGRRIGW